ncbi:MAG TPA: nitroreductase family protein [Ignavibacteriaceae bacterium]|nr:nitroreductase family protein [Ignavibacteriaceae bacterium]
MHYDKFVPLASYIEYPEEVMKERSKLFYEDLKRRRTVRDFADKKVPQEVVENCIKAASTAPSGANKQPWHFVVISDPIFKKQIRIAAEEEEREFYSGKAPKEWLNAVEPFGTDEHKPFLETAPYLIAIFAKSYETNSDGQKEKNYYVQESVGIASGILITAIHNAGLVSLTHTPSPMNFLNKILERPENERPYLILVVGYPAKDAKEPVITKKTIKEVATFL